MHLSLSAQSLRYFDTVFNEVKTDSNIVYGSNYTYNVLSAQFGLTQEDLTLDIYQPVDDTLSNRPLIIWAHGGSFLGGTKNDADIEYFCNEFAKRGFVTTSINYRLGFEAPVDSVEAVRAVYRALQDGRAAVRYMRSIADSLHVDPNKIYFGGTSAGAFIALNITYLNLPEEVPSYLDTNARLSLNAIRGFGLDGIEGLTNDIKESSEIQGIINFCGATKTTNWLADSYARNTPIISMHGTEDGTVPYATRVINLNDITPLPPQIPLPIVGVQGSYDIDRYLDSTGNSTSAFYTWYGADHVPYIGFNNNDVSRAYMDTLMSFTVKHVYEDFLGLGSVDGLDENDPPCDFNNGDVSPCETSVGVNESNIQEASMYPNPFKDNLILSETSELQSVRITNITGKIVYEANADQKNINTTSFTPGIYVVTMILNNGTQRNIRIVKQ